MRCPLSLQQKLIDTNLHTLWKSALYVDVDYLTVLSPTLLTIKNNQVLNHKAWFVSGSE